MHAEHFVALVYDALKESLEEERPPILTSLFDAELFGHWWYEGPKWLEHVARILAQGDIPIALTTCSEYLDKHPAEGVAGAGRGLVGKKWRQRSLAQSRYLLDLVAHLRGRTGGARDCRR